MSDDERIADQCDRALEIVRGIEPETGYQERALQDAESKLEGVPNQDRRRNGPTPTDALAKLVGASDETAERSDTDTDHSGGSE